MVVAVISFIIFSYILIPFRIHGHSMEPTYKDRGFNFCFRLRYVFSKPSPQDVVAIRFAGKRVMLLKRVIATEGQVVSFQNGKLFIDGKMVDEPYVKYPSDWNLSPRKVEKDRVYVIGDNRNVPIEQHDFGQTSYDRIIGVPVW